MGASNVRGKISTSNSVDWQRPKFYNTLHILRAAGDLRIPVVAVPHGINLAKNIHITWRTLKENADADYGYNWRYFDYNVVQFKEYKDRVVCGGVDPQKVIVLGNTRYCKKWRGEYENIFPFSQQINNSPDHRLKVWRNLLQ